MLGYRLMRNSKPPICKRRRYRIFLSRDRQDRYLNASGSVTGGTIDASADVILKGAVYHEPWTIIRMSRSIFTGDDEDVPFVAGPMAVQWAYSFTDLIGEGHPLDTRGRANVTFIPL